MKHVSYQRGIPFLNKSNATCQPFIKPGYNGWM